MNAYQRHIRKLAKEHDIAVLDILPPEQYGRASSSTYGRDIQIAPVAGEHAERNYWIALHEIGHVMRDHRPGENFRYGLGRTDATQVEAEAWDWALDNAIEPIGPQGIAAIREGYVGHWRQAPLPPSHSREIERLADLAFDDPDLSAAIAATDEAAIAATKINVERILQDLLARLPG